MFRFDSVARRLIGSLMQFGRRSNFGRSACLVRNVVPPLLGRSAEAQLAARAMEVF